MKDDIKPQDGINREGIDQDLNKRLEEQDGQIILPGGIDITHIRVSLTEVIPDPVPILIQTKTGIAIFTERGLSMVIGASKSRKTTLSTGLGSACLGDISLGLEACRDDLKVVYIDTEQGRQYSAMTLRKIHRLMKDHGWDVNTDNDRLKYYDLREYSKEQRLEVVEYITKTERPNVMFIDGVVDLCKNFNEIAESELVVQKLMKMTVDFNMHICCCLHFNKDGTTARGHLGAIYMQKCETVIRIENKGEYSVVKPDKEGCRLKPFEQFCITMDEDYGFPVLFDETSLAVIPSMQKPKPMKERAMTYAKAAFENNDYKPMRHNDLVRAIMEEAQASTDHLSDSTAKRYIKRLLEDSYITQINSNMYQLTRLDENSQSDLDFEDPTNAIGEPRDDCKF